MEEQDVRKMWYIRTYVCNAKFNTSVEFMYVRMMISKADTHTHTHAAHTHACTYARTHTCTHARTYAHTHTHTHTHARMHTMTMRCFSAFAVSNSG